MVTLTLVMLHIRKTHKPRCELDYRSQDGGDETFQSEIYSHGPIQRSVSGLQCQSIPDNASTTNVVLQIIFPDHTSNNEREDLTEQLFSADGSNQHLHMGQLPTEAETHPSTGKAFMLKKIQKLS